MTDANQLIVLRDNAKSQLMQIKTVEDGITHLNKLKAIEVWVKAEKKDAELQNIVAEQKLRTQRILGELIKEGQENGEIASQAINGGGIQTGLPVVQARKPITDLGINHKQSSAFQAIASIPEEAFEEFIAEKKAAVNNAVAELTTTGAVRLAKSLEGKTEKSKPIYDASINYDEEVQELLSRINALPPFYRLKVRQGIRK
jgi:hypothetical protein